MSEHSNESFSHFLFWHTGRSHKRENITERAAFLRTVESKSPVFSGLNMHIIKKVHRAVELSNSAIHFGHKRDYEGFLQTLQNAALDRASAGFAC